MGNDFDEEKKNLTYNFTKVTCTILAITHQIANKKSSMKYQLHYKNLNSGVRKYS